MFGWGSFLGVVATTLNNTIKDGKINSKRFHCFTAGKGDEKTKDETDDSKPKNQTDSQTNKDEGKQAESDIQNIIWSSVCTE